MSLYLTKRLFDNNNIDLSICTPNEHFENILKNKSNDISSLIILTKLLPKITNFDDQCIKYLCLIQDQIKNEFNVLKRFNTNALSILNTSLSIFVKYFYKNYQTYNDKHKNVLKSIHNFLQIFFKLLKENFDTLINKTEYTKNLESCFIFILTIIKYNPTLLRPYQNQIEYFLEIIFTQFTYDKQSLSQIQTYIMVYCSLCYLSPTIEEKFGVNISKIIKHLQRVNSIFKPKAMNDEDNLKEVKEDYDNNNNNTKIKEVNFFKKEFIKNDNIIQSMKYIDLFFEILTIYFKVIPKDVLVNINFEDIFNYYNNFIDEYNKMSNTINQNISFNKLSISGLSHDNYKIFIDNILLHIMSNLNFLILNYSYFITYYNEKINQIISLLILNQNIINQYESLNNLLPLLNSFIISFTKYSPNITENIISKISYSVFPTFFYKYLELVDNSVVQIDRSYFKMSNCKNQINLIKKASMSDKIYSKREYENIINHFLNIFKTFIIINSNYLFNTNTISIFNGIIDLLLLPSYSKFLFNVNSNIKLNILLIIELALKTKKININKNKVFNFINGFFERNSLIEYSCLNIIKFIDECNYSSSNSSDYEKNNIVEYIVNFNNKFEEIVKNNIEIMNNINQNDLLGKKRNSSNENIIEEKDIEITEINPKSKNKKDIKKNQKQIKNSKVNTQTKNKANNIKNVDFKNNDDSDFSDDNIEIPDLI